MTKLGHNSGDTDPGVVPGAELRELVKKIEKLDEDIGALNSAKSEIYSHAKGIGLDTKALRHVVKLRRQDPDARREFEAIVELYTENLGMNSSGDQE